MDCIVNVTQNWGIGKDGDQLTARTEGGRLVRMYGDDALIGQFVHAKITGCTTWSLVGELAE